MSQYGVETMMGRLSSQSGFTLIEVIGAVMVFAFGILALYRSQIGSIENNSFANDITSASMLAQQKMEEFRNLHYDNPTNPGDLAWPLNDRIGDGTGNDTNKDGIDDTGSANEFGLSKTGAAADHTETSGRFTVSWNIAVDEPITGNKLIRVIVQWDEKDGTHSVSMDGIKVRIPNTNTEY
jgi:prepilin-type N-terminal cleavage/methylation domain-containing protein